jgi:hypothetical protein
VAVRFGPRDNLACDLPVRAGPILDYDWLPQELGQLRRRCPGKQVVPAPWRIGDHELDWLGGVAVGSRGCGTVQRNDAGH